MSACRFSQPRKIDNRAIRASRRNSSDPRFEQAAGERLDVDQGLQTGSNTAADEDRRGQRIGPRQRSGRYSHPQPDEVSATDKAENGSLFASMSHHARENDGLPSSSQEAQSSRRVRPYSFGVDLDQGTSL
jgi:hypothetical protein